MTDECQFDPKGKIQLTGVKGDKLWLMSKSSWKGPYEQFIDEIFTV